MADTSRIRRYYLGNELPIVKDGPPLGTNNANANALMVLLDELSRMTEQLIEADRKRWYLKECVHSVKPISPIPCEETSAQSYDRGEYSDDTTVELQRWIVRLDYYIERCNQAIADHRGDDPAEILYDVTSPLFFGYFYPEEWPYDVVADGLPDVPPSYWDTRLVADLSTPFALAAGLNADVSFQQDLDLTSSLVATAKDYAHDGARAVEKLWDAASDVVSKAATKAAWIVGGAVLLGVVVYAATR